MKVTLDDSAICTPKIAEQVAEEFGSNLTKAVCGEQLHDMPMYDHVVKLAAGHSARAGVKLAVKICEADSGEFTVRDARSFLENQLASADYQ